MATTRINVSRVGPHGDNLLTAIAQIREARDRLAHAKSIMETCIDSGDYNQLESLFGIQTSSGETVYNLIAGVCTDLAGFNISATIARMG